MWFSEYFLAIWAYTTTCMWVLLGKASGVNWRSSLKIYFLWETALFIDPNPSNSRTNERGKWIASSTGSGILVQIGH